MSPMEKFFANLKRLLEPRARPPAESIERSTADRPPPPEGAPSETRASPEVVLAVEDTSEVRALLEAVAEAPVAAPEPEAQASLPISEPEAQLSLPVSEPEPTPSADRTPVFSPAIDQGVADVLSAASDGVGNTLVLTLATPAATFSVARSSATLGRGQENTVRLDDFSVSRRHARIAYRGGGYWLSDLGSMGGTWVDGVKLNAPRRIAAGQVIDIGVCRLTVSFAADPVRIEPRKSASKARSEIAEQARRRR